MRNKSRDEARLMHIVEAILEIQSYLKDTYFESFSKDSMKKHATIKQLEIIGEAANYVSEDIKKSYPKIKWNEIIGLRNILIHQYFGIDENLIWEIVKNDIPELKDQVLHILDGLE